MVYDQSFFIYNGIMMQYLWEEFNIKTFPAETIVFRDGVFMPDLSTLKSATIDKKHDLPIHIIYVGKIAGENNLEINVNVADTNVFLTAKIKNEKPAFLNIYVKNTGKNSFVRGKILADNSSELKIYKKGNHLAENTGIILQTKLIAHDNSKTRLIGIAEIARNCPNCDSDIGFSAIAAQNAMVEFFPAQLISSIPTAAEHSASIYRGTHHQIQYLRSAGLDDTEIKTALREAFINDTLEF